MDHLKIFFIVAAVLTLYVECRSYGNTYHHHASHGPDQYHLGLPQAIPDVSHLVDTHEVAAAKHAHLSALAAHSHHNSHDYTDHEHTGRSIVHEHEHIKPYHGPLSIPVVLPSGHLADTSEVAVAKSHHLAAVAQAKADKYYGGHAESGYGGAYGYSGSHHGYGVPVVLPNGHIADTREVAAAKSAHLLAVAKAKADQYYSGHGQDYGYGQGHGYSSSYHGYGIPVVLPNGHLADTHEVAAAKSAHMIAVAHAKAEQAHSEYYHHPEDRHEEYVHHEVLYLPYLNPHYVQHQESHYTPLHEPHYSHAVVLLPSGLLTDTHEGAVAKTPHLNYLAQAEHPVLFRSHHGLY